MNQKEFFTEVLKILEKLHIPYMISGSGGYQKWVIKIYGIKSRMPQNFELFFNTSAIRINLSSVFVYAGVTLWLKLQFFFNVAV